LGLTLWLLLRVPEPKVLPAPTPGWRQGWALLRANRPFQRLLSAYFLNGLANSLPATLFIYFVRDFLGSKDLAGPLLLLYFTAAILGLPFWLRLAAKGSKHTTWCWAMLWSCAFFLLAPLLQPGDLVPFAAICVLTGLALGADLALPPAMQADVVDQDSAEGGNSRAGLYFALWGLVTKLTTALGVGLAFPVLDWAGFSAMGNNSEGALSVLVVLYALVPVGLKLSAIFLMRNFPLTQEVQSALALRIQSKGN
jgi:Na+/melibiose symporter-like transporter